MPPAVVFSLFSVRLSALMLVHRHCTRGASGETGPSMAAAGPHPVRPLHRNRRQLRSTGLAEAIDALVQMPVAVRQGQAVAAVLCAQLLLAAPTCSGPWAACDADGSWNRGAAIGNLRWWFPGTRESRQASVGPDCRLHSCKDSPLSLDHPNRLWSSENNVMDQNRLLHPDSSHSRCLKMP
ncbi:hypothetical protein GGTG_03086 [Gaeumannomyces tritici R3-111a-1]|uniref:Secreted protein n=1 Tax=Gaeumannomyces tritici (strain R3-111a-1) TaxID=644352 RepID=J3NP80_GAET3|nr:hypothetical protein GGTG_03086 [Gaeumannomyces tritici R3-111a-1]EJT77983.1 hypothetical protein GGTG_03086 [Gaeumannomyces tritici R3-111a-1]